MSGRLMLLFCGLSACLRAAPLPNVPEEALEELGTTSGTPQTGGFVFIEGRYVPPPYTVVRKGNGIFVNRIQIAQPVSWERITGVVPEEPKSTGDGDFEEVDVKPAEVAPAPEPEPDEPRKPTIDDLFADEDEEEEKPAPAKKTVEVAAPAPAPVPAPVVKKPSAPPVPQAPLSKEKVKENLDKLRLRYETALGRSEFFFFSTEHSLITGNRGTARTLIKVLPGALRAAVSPDDLLSRLQAGGVYFLDLATARMLYRNKLTFPQLQLRLEKVEREEAAEARERMRRVRERVRGY